VDLRVENLGHLYTGRPGVVEALQNINLNISSGEFVAIVGPSGCGKSTLLRILAGLMTPSYGSVHIGGRLPAEVIAEKQVGWLAQNPALLPWRTVRSNIALAQRINPQKRCTPKTASQLLSLVGLSDFADVYPFSLSGGMQQRAALARTIALGAKVWLMDEPFAALDELTREDLARELLRIWKTIHPTVVWVTHNILEAVRLADRVMVLSPRPGHFATEVRVEIPVPRNETSPEFLHILRELRRQILVSSGCESQIQATQAKSSSLK
jgi:NitT/TauT family transport system ATP-binding protein